MKSFLSDIAEYIISKHGQSLGNVTVLMPNRRSCVFLQRELSERISETTWAPQILSLQDWIVLHSPLKLVEEIVAVFKLYETYRTLFPQSHETFDSFYFEGQIMLNDFNDIDSELVDAKKLFINLLNLKSISYEFSSNEEYAHILQRFSEIFSTTAIQKKPNNTTEIYLGIWQKLLPLYNAYRNDMIRQGMAYDGLLQRHFVETKLPHLEIEKNHPIYIIGFNALSQSEQKIFDTLKKSFPSFFFWDYDDFYLLDEYNKAGFYLRDLIKRYPMPNDFKTNTSAIKNKKVEIYAMPNEVAQAKFLTSFLKNQCTDDTSIILLNENMLNAVMTYLPAQNDNVNITMGYNIRNTSAYTLIKLIFSLQSQTKEYKGQYYFSKKQFINVLYHPYFSQLEWAKQLLSYFLKPSDRDEPVFVNDMISWVEMNSLFNQNHVPDVMVKIMQPSTVLEYLSNLIELLRLCENYLLAKSNIIPLNRIEIQVIRKLYNELDNVKSLLSIHHIVIQNITTLQRLLLQMVQRINIHFHGEPLEGLQIMGLMESRLLDFKQVVLLSANEGILPADSFSTSFILYALREYFGLPTPQRREAIDAYHFYRLIQRSENITILFARYIEDEERDKSPLVRQLLYNDHIQTYEHILSDHIVKPASLQEEMVLEKKQVIEEWNHYLAYIQQKGLSHHAISLYLQCPLQFYFTQVKRLKPEELFPEEFSNADMGLLFHEIVEKLFNTYSNVDEVVLNKIIGNADTIINSVFKEHYKEESGVILLLKTQVKSYVYKFLNTEKNRVPYTILSIENELDHIVNINDMTLRLYGRPDRIIQQNGTYQILDFKTGKENKTIIQSVEDVFASNVTMKYLFQLFFYGYLFSKKMPEAATVHGELIFIKKYNAPKKNALCLTIDKSKKYELINISAFANFFETLLIQKCHEIFSNDIPFIQTSDKKNCTYCDFNLICKKI